MNNIERRSRCLSQGEEEKGPIVCWLSRDLRAQDNWALLYAQELALARKKPLLVVFCLSPKFLGATARAYDFLLQGLEELALDLEALNIPFYILLGEAKEELPIFIKKQQASILVTDFSPLKIARTWKSEVAEKISCPFYEVDAHNIVPVWLASDKQEFAARTIRPKINKLLPDFLVSFPRLKKHPYSKVKPLKHNWKKYRASLNLDESVSLPSSWTPGTKAAEKRLRQFIKNGLAGYADGAGDANADHQSELSPYLHFGQISAQKVALEVSQSKAPLVDREKFLEELIIRRELADNFCFYNNNYDKPEGFPAWARESLKKHRKDKREYIYKLSDFEKANTHDDIWNAAQRELLISGKMFGYVRMYWAKKILEWSESYEQALKTAIYLNDRYSLDGRDPNGYVGVAWSIGGIHDRPFSERKVFGKVRYMGEGACKRHFNIKEYINKWN